MTHRIGIVGHRDFIDGMMWAVHEQPSVQGVPIAYDSPAELDDLLQEHGRRLDGVLTADRRVRRRVEELLPGMPTGHVEHASAALVQMMFRLTLAGVDIARASIDALDAGEVADLYAELDIPTTDVTAPERRDALSEAETVELHREHARRTRGAVAITADPRVRTQLGDAGHEVRLVYPHATSVQVALRQLLVGMSTVMASDARVVVGLVEGAETGALEEEVTTLGGTLLPGSGEVHTVLLTYGPLLAATSRFTTLPMLGRLADLSAQVHVGLGVAPTADQGLREAATALAGARELGPVGAVISGTGGAPVVLAMPLTEDTIESIPPRVLAQRAGLSVTTLASLHEALKTHGDEPLTSLEIGQMLDLRPREARRVIERLELVGMAEREGTDRSDRAGRPRIRYRLHL
ncbi:hypothetical protein [Georgenia subflava]|uniref:Uncharacterized protein n=1 Tax=Georgenia subflava TaxID=1622177 RepID=A0A6N7EE48_9MICO|nr:hypothetical protein [Georgenia subflava]MPV35611.1 hypothetical protein [Georgenia subflava]